MRKLKTNKIDDLISELTEIRKMKGNIEFEVEIDYFRRPHGGENKTMTAKTNITVYELNGVVTISGDEE